MSMDSEESSEIKCAGFGCQEVSEKISLECLDELLLMGKELNAPESDLDFLT